MLTLFSIPKPFRGHIDIIQRNAIKSWTLLDPGVEVILFGEEEGVASAARELGVRHEPHVNRNEFGTPLLDSVFDRAQEIARHPIVCYVNCDIVLLNDFCASASRVAAWRDQFLMAGRRWDADITETIDFSQSDWREQDAQPCSPDKPAAAALLDRLFRLSAGPVSPQTSSLCRRPAGLGPMDDLVHPKYQDIPVVDASRSVMAVHQNHDYSHHPLGFKGRGVRGAIMPFHKRPGPQLLSGGCQGNCGMGSPAALASVDLVLLVFLFGDCICGLVGNFSTRHKDRREGGVFAECGQSRP